MRCGDGLIHGTKRHKDNQSERLNHLYKTKFTNIFDDKLRAPKSYGAVAFFFTRGQFWPSGIVVACVCVCLSVCLSITCLSSACAHIPRLFHGPDCFTVSTRCTYIDLGSRGYFGVNVALVSAWYQNLKRVTFIIETITLQQARCST